MMKRKLSILLAFTAATGATVAAWAEAPAWMPGFEQDGTVHVRAFDLPLSDFISTEAANAQKSRAKSPGNPVPRSSDILESRRRQEEYFRPMVAATMARYPADIVEQKIAGVRTRVITPKNVRVDNRRVLINLHGGGFNACAEPCAMLESLPIASVGGFKVITVDYRLAPEHVFPAASEDVAAVYRELLKTYKANQIGIYGCSAGGSLSAQMAAWLPAHGLPQAGAIGIFGSGGVRGRNGDSTWIAAHVDGVHPPPQPKSGQTRPAFRSYFEGANMDDPLVSPAQTPSVAARFPPTLVITGTRASDLSRAIVTHSKLLDAGVDSNLIVGEGMGHCYIYQSSLPEAQSAYRAIAKFFKTRLK